MVRETRHLWVGNLPDNIREDRIREHFKRYGRVQSVKLLPRSVKEETGENTAACTVAFMDIKSASKAHTAEHKIDEKTLTTEYYEPAAIPSAASPQNTNSTYATSPSSIRFTNNHGTTEEHGNFPERFYERNNSRVTDAEYIRRTSYHDNRGRNRDRGYRNGPYNNVIDRHRPVNSTWSYDSTRNYNSETGYGTTPSDTNDRRSSDSQSTKKKTKSRSGSRSISPSGSTSSRSPTRSRSQSSSSSSSSTTSHASSNSTGSPKSRRAALSANPSHQPVVHSDDRRPLAICVRNLPLRSSDTSLKDGLFHEYKKHGKVTWVKIVGQGAERHAIVCFKKPEDVDKALEVSYDKLFFGCKIEVAPYQGYDVDDNELRPYEAEIDEFHPKATRTLFIGNLEKDVTASDLRKHFDQFGEIIEIDIKKQGAVSSYAFCQYSDIISVVKAIRAMDGEHLGNNRIKLGFGKSMPTNCVWLDGVVDSVNEKYLTLQFDSFGPITEVKIDRDKGQGLIFYDQVVNAQAAVAKMRGVNMRGRKMQVDFASRECQEAFYEHLEKEGHPTDRTNFEERNSAVRTFDAAVPTAANRFARYETPTRPRTASYSSRSSVTAGQCNATSTVHSPSTPGSVTPRGSGSRSRLARFTEYYEQGATEYGDRRYKSYDEYSQGSPASHEDGYEHEYAFNRESPSHVDTLESRSLQHNTELTLTFAPPDIRNLQKERYHLLEQLEDYPSSGDELASPKKRIRLDVLEGSAASDVIIEANRDHRKVMEVRRTSEGSVKHHSRRPSVDSKHGAREVGIDRIAYLPHAVCKRRKTAGSDSSSKIQHHELSGSESVGSSRPGTPLCDEKPDFPTEPRRIPREREGPLSLPLPRFAAQLMGKGNVSVAGIKGQKDNVLASPPPAATSPRVSTPLTPSLAQVPPPASPPPRPPSLSSNSSDSDITPPSPSLDERIRSLDEKYEKWSGSRAVSAAGSEALAKLDASASERFRFSYKLLDLDLKELQPSDIVKSVLAKPSVFDEDSKRLENVGEKYEINLFPKTPTPSAQTTVPVPPLPTQPPVLKVATTTAQLPKTPTIQSPRSSGSSNITTAKGLQYPFPSHPPLQPVISAPSTPTPPVQASQPLPPTSTSRVSHGDNRLKLCANTPSGDSRTSSKLSVNRNSSAVTNSTQSNNSKNGVNIPVNPSDNAPVSSNADVSTKVNKSARDKVTNRRDSASSGGSPRGEIRNRRNSESSGRRSELGDKQSDNCDNACDRKSDEKEKSEEWKRELQRIENERLEKERLEKESLERERLEQERLEKERLEKERLERERIERERLEKERLERERLEKERLEKERVEKERLERESRREREEKERKEREDREKREREEQERIEREKRERREKEERERREREEKETKEKEEQERMERERKREEERKHRDDNHEKRRDEHLRHRDNHGESKHKDSTERSERNTKESRTKDNDVSRKDTSDSKNNHENKSNHESREIRRDDKSKHHQDRDSDKKRDNCKENRENNLHDKIVNIVNEVKENSKPIESRHFSIDNEKSKVDIGRRKERNNSLPANVGSKRRLSSQDSLESLDEIKKLKLSQDHRKISDRRDSKDVRSEEKVKVKHKNNIAKIIEDKLRHEKFNSVKEVKDRDKEEKHKHKQKTEKQRSKEKSRDKDSPISKLPSKDSSVDKDFLARLDLQSTEDSEKIRQRKESKEKRKQEGVELEERKTEEHRKTEDRKKEKRPSTERKVRDENLCHKSDEKKKKERIRKVTSSDAATDSDEPKKQPHSIFDIVDDEPAYISMYDKVKARSCKNMQKQEEEKRQEKLKAKFNQLKQSRAKREEKKRSTSWDEDSDSDHDRQDPNSKNENIKVRKSSKALITSSDDDGVSSRGKPRRKRDIYNTDSDSDKHRINKIDHIESSDDENMKSKKPSKSRIASDTSDDDFKTLRNKIKSEIFSDSELDNAFIDLEEKSHKKVKDEDKYNKKDKRSKQELTTEQISVQIFGESPIPESKSESTYDNSRIFGDVSSAEETHEIKKEKADAHRKRKKKQKRQKHSLTSEDDTKLELTVELIKDESIERMKNSEKKRQHSKKDKKKDKCKDETKHKDKSRKSKKSKSELGKFESKRDGKMENIFGSFSDDSEHGSKDPERSDHSFLDRFGDDKLQMYPSDSDSISHIEKELQKSEVKEQRKEEHKKRKEKKRREKEKRMREEEINENSMDYIDMGKQLEANIKDDSDDILDTTTTSLKSEPDERNEDSFRCTDLDEIPEVKLEVERKESREKKKKRKKSKEEKHNKHHHHHHDKNKLKSPEIKKEFDLSSESIAIEEKATLPSPSLPNILELPSPPVNKPNSPPSAEFSPPPLVNCIPKTPTKDKKRDKLIPGFGSEIDEKIHETAIKSISEFKSPKLDLSSDIKEEPNKIEKVEPAEEKPRVVISQEETEDAVAALLGESFGGNEYSSCYSDDQQNLDSSEQDTNVPEDNIAEDLEEMRQAVQSLNSTDLEIKPDTPQSENDLQIDTDTEEQEETGIRYDQPPKTPDLIVEAPQPPKAAELPSTYFRSDDQKPPTLVIKATSLSSPPSLTPIKPMVLPHVKSGSKGVLENVTLPHVKTGSKGVLENVTSPHVKTCSKGVLENVTVAPKPVAQIQPVKPEEPKIVPPQTVNTERKPAEILKPEVECQQVPSLNTIKPVPFTTPSTRSFSQPVLTVSEKPNIPPITVQSKQEPLQNFTDTKVFSPTAPNVKQSPVTVPYSTKIHVQYNAAHQKQSVTTTAHTPPTPTTTISFNRLPITPVMMAKSFQQTVSLPQPISAKSEFLGSSVDQHKAIHQPPQSPSPYILNSQSRMLLQGIPRALPHHTAPKPIPSVTYTPYSNTTSFTPAVSKETAADNPKNLPELPTLVTSSYPSSFTVSPHVTSTTLITQASPQITPKPIGIKPIVPIIQETPGLVSLSSYNPPQPASKTVNVCQLQLASKIVTVSQPQPSSKIVTASQPQTSIKTVTVFQPQSVPLEEVKMKKEPLIEKQKVDLVPVKVDVPEPLPVKEALQEKLPVIEKQEVIETKVSVEPSVPKDKPEIKLEEKVEILEPETKVNKLDLEPMSVIKKIDRFDDDKGETESVESDISKERIDLVSKDDGLDSKEDSDYWSAKEVNIDSVIQKVEALCSADELSDRSSEIGKDDWFEHDIKTSEEAKIDIPEGPQNMKVDNSTGDDVKMGDSEVTEEEEQSEGRELPIRGGRRGGRARGRKTRGVDRGGVQTRRAKVMKEEVVPTNPTSIVVSKRGGRGGRCKNERKTLKCELENSDVYEFRDDTDENKDRPRLILTIKSPVTPISNSGGVLQAAVVKEVVAKESVLPKAAVEGKEDFVSPTNTRKSRRLQERDVSRNTVDDTIEDVIRNTIGTTRSAAPIATSLQMRRSARQTASKVIQETPRKSPRGGVRRKDRQGSENTDDSCEEKSVKLDALPSNQEATKLAPSVPIKEPAKELEEEKAEFAKEKPHEGLKAAMLRRVKGEMNQQEPMTLIDPVTGLLTPMRECEEGRYIPVSGTINQLQAAALKLPKTPVTQPSVTQPPFSKPSESVAQSVITTSPVIQQQKPQSLKAHVLHAQVARVVVSQPQPQKLVSSTPIVSQPNYIAKQNVPISQHLNITVSSPNLSPAHISPRPNAQPSIAKSIHSLPPGLKVVQQQAPPSPNQSAAHQPKQQHILQPVNKQPQVTISKGHHVPVALSNTNQQQIVNTQLAHMKQIVGKGPAIKPHGLHPQPQILTGAVASPPLKQTHHVNPQQIPGANTGRLIQGSASVPNASAKGSMEPPKVEVSMGGCVMVPHPSSSPQGQQRHVLQTGMPITAFEASLGEAMTHFPPGSVKLRAPHDLLPAHYMHPQHVMYQQYLRQSYHMPSRSPLVSGNVEKAGDGQEGEEAPVELRRPGSVGLALTGRSPAVPLSLQSPHDRTTDSPQLGQVYNMHNSRLHYHPGRYYEQATEPPPAHRPLTSHSSLAALGNDRPLSHIGPINTPPERPLGSHLPSERPLSSHLPSERPLSSHLPQERSLGAHPTLPTSHITTLGVPDRPISTHIPPDRPLSSNHGFPLGTGLGAAGNLMGAVARHVGAEAPASQRGLQAATPPHASQVPPQAESLLMLLKQYPCMWQGLLALKNDQAAVQMYFVSGNDQVAKCSLPKNTDGSTPPLRIFQRMRLEPPQVEGVARKMQMENEHCMLLALPCGHDHMDVLKQSTNLSTGFITYLQQKQAAGIVNVAAPGTTQPPAYVVHIFPSCDFVNENLRRIAPNLLERVSDIAHLLIVITTV